MRNTIQNLCRYNTNRRPAVSGAWLRGLALFAAVFLALQITALPARAEIGQPPKGTGPKVAERTNNLQDPPELSGGEIRFLENRGSVAQQLSAVIRSSDGHVLVVDGGQAADVDHLLETLRMAGGHVDAWLITHPQTDHVGALREILAEHRGEITVDGFYYHFFDLPWYHRVDPDEYGAVWLLAEQLNAQEEGRLHGSLERGDEVVLSEHLSFRVINSPVASEDSYAVNSSGLMYDINIEGKHLVILGDMAAEVGDSLMNQGVLDGIKADYVQVSHHGQDGVSEAFYRRLQPDNCIWPTTDWIYNAGPINRTNLRTTLTKGWFARMPIKNHYITIGDDVIIH